MHKSGFVNIIGNPNVGKSTLLNALVGERLSIIPPRLRPRGTVSLGSSVGKISKWSSPILLESSSLLISCRPP